MSKRSSEKLGKIPPRAAFLEEKPSFHRGKGGSWKSRVCFYENSSPIRATIFPLTKQDTESLSRYGCFAYRSSQLFLFSQCNEFRFNALSLLPPSPIDSRVRPDGILRNEWARRRHERRRVIEPLKLSFADPNFVAVGIDADTMHDRRRSGQLFVPIPPSILSGRGGDTSWTRSWRRSMDARSGRCLMIDVVATSKNFREGN